MDLSGYIEMDGIDIWTGFRMIVEEGTADALALPPAKPKTEHDWGDSNGRDVDVSRIFFDQREIALKCAILVESEAQYWVSIQNLKSQLLLPGLRRLTIAAHGQRSYYVYYMEINNYHQVKALKGQDHLYTIAHRFTLVLVEPEPVVDSSHVFIVDDAGKFLIV